MVLIGIDPHKATHTAVAVDKEETQLGELTVKADRDQVERLLLRMKLVTREEFDVVAALAQKARAEQELKELGKIRVPSRSSYFGIIDLA